LILQGNIGKNEAKGSQVRLRRWDDERNKLKLVVVKLVVDNFRYNFVSHIFDYAKKYKLTKMKKNFVVDHNTIFLSSFKAIIMLSIENYIF
jgi:hypothetical protein